MAPSSSGKPPRRSTDSSTVVITGIGVVCPAGNSLGVAWEAVCEGRRFVSPITVGGQTSRTSSRETGAVVSCFEPPEGTQQNDRVIQFAMAAAREALSQAGVTNGAGAIEVDPAHLKVAVGTSKGGILTFSELADRIHARRPIAGSHSLFDVPPDASSRCIAAHLNACGGMHTTVTACATATQAMIRGCRYLFDGDADMVICGGADASLHPLWLAAFRRMGVLAEAHTELGPGHACQPFDRRRRGFVVGEGAGIFVLETLESASRRGAKPLARVAGFAEGSDPTALTRMDESGRRLAALVNLALQRAGCRAEDLAAIHSHGTGTVSNDLIEYRAYRAILGSRLPDVPLASIKGAIGHLLGAAGGVETAVAVQSLRTRMCPAHATLVESDPCLEGLRIPTSPMAIRRGPVLKTSLGFGGHLAALILEEV